MVTRESVSRERAIGVMAGKSGVQGHAVMAGVSARSRFYGGLEQTAAAREWLGLHLRGAGLADRDVDAFELAITEATGNILRHAYEGKYPAAFEIDLSIGDDSVTATLTDEGRPFAPGDVRAPDADELSESGYGLFLIESLMDEVVYTPEARGTTLRLTRRRNPPEPSPDAPS
jgi:serine/threonine-protein kinase RsbW